MLHLLEGPAQEHIAERIKEKNALSGIPIHDLPVFTLVGSAPTPFNYNII